MSIEFKIMNEYGRIKEDGKEIFVGEISWNKREVTGVDIRTIYDGKPCKGVTIPFSYVPKLIELLHDVNTDNNTTDDFDPVVLRNFAFDFNTLEKIFSDRLLNGDHEVNMKKENGLWVDRKTGNIMVFNRKSELNNL